MIYVLYKLRASENIKSCCPIVLNGWVCTRISGHECHFGPPPMVAERSQRKSEQSEYNLWILGLSARYRQITLPGLALVQSTPHATYLKFCPVECASYALDDTSNPKYGLFAWRAYLKEWTYLQNAIEYLHGTFEERCHMTYIRCHVARMRPL